MEVSQVPSLAQMWSGILIIWVECTICWEHLSVTCDSRLQIKIKKELVCASWQLGLRKHHVLLKRNGAYSVQWKLAV